MVNLEASLWSLVIIFVMIIISALPLYFAVNLLGGRTTILKAFLVMLITAILATVIAAIFPFGTLIAAFILIWIYHEVFRLRWIKAFIAWILQIVFYFLIAFLLTIFGLGYLIVELFII